MSLVFDCCCGPPPDQCECNCVCPHAWHITDPHRQGNPYMGVLYSVEPLLWEAHNSGNQDEFSIVLWTDTCLEEDEAGYFFNLHSDDQDDHVYGLAQYVGSAGDFNYLADFGVRVESEESDPVGADAVVGLRNMKQSEGGCLMWVFSYERVTDIDGFKVPFQRLWRIGNGIEERAEQEFLRFGVEADFTFSQPFDPMGLWIGSRWPKGDPNYHPVPGTYTQEWYFRGCISNFTIYDRALTDVEVVQAWNSGNGLLDDTAWERWCSTDPWTQKQIGEIKGKPLEFHGPVQDELLTDILDDADALIHAVDR